MTFTGMRTVLLLAVCFNGGGGWLMAAPPSDPRLLSAGPVIPDEGYCDQPYTIITQAGHWLCVMTTGKGIEGQQGQHVVATISSDQSKTWSPLIDIEPADGPEASWALPLLTPTGRVYVFYTYNADRVKGLGDPRNTRADMMGQMVYKYSDDHGRSWSAERYRIPIRHTEYDRINDLAGKVQFFWCVGDPIVIDGSAYLGFSKIAKYLVSQTEGWFLRSDNVLSEPDPAQHRWEMLPDGDVGLRPPAGPIGEEHFLVPLSGGKLYAIGRTVTGFLTHHASVDGGHTWTAPTYATYGPAGRQIKNSRACPRLWRAGNGKYLLWYHHHSGQSFEGRNPVFLTGGVERDGTIQWAEPEIVLYDDDPNARISYPDLIEQDGRYWLTETNKEVARVHPIDATLLEGLWSQPECKAVSQAGLLVSLDAARLAETGGQATLPTMPEVARRGGFSLDLWLRLEDVSAGQVILDTRDAAGRGWCLRTADRASLSLDLCDGRQRTVWDSDPQTLEAGRLHHVVAIVDGAARIISYVVDGVYQDGGAYRESGWGRLSPTLQNIQGTGPLRIAPSLPGSVVGLRIFNRYLRTTEAVSHFHAGPDAWVPPSSGPAPK